MTIIRADLLPMACAFRASPPEPISRWDYLLPPPDSTR